MLEGDIARNGLTEEINPNIAGFNTDVRSKWQLKGVSLTGYHEVLIDGGIGIIDPQ